jgi:hypothetical protein
VISSAQMPAIQASPQLGYPVLVNAPETRIMRIGIDAMARSIMFVTFHLMTRSVRHIAPVGGGIRAPFAQT